MSTASLGSHGDIGPMAPTPLRDNETRRHLRGNHRQREQADAHDETSRDPPPYGDREEVAVTDGGEGDEAVVNRGEALHRITRGGASAEDEGIGNQPGSEDVRNSPHQSEHQVTCDTGTQHFGIDPRRAEDESQ